MRGAAYGLPRIPLPETVWKIGIASSLGPHQWAKGIEKPHFALLCHRTYTIERPFSYFPNSFSETVWKIRMGSTVWSHESEKGGEKHPYRRFGLPITHHPDPSSYFPNSFSRH